MTAGPLFSHTRGPAEVIGVHGAQGHTRWTCFTRRAGLDGDWEAIEWASVPPGGLSGEHLHTRTEEVYVILSGRGEVCLNGDPTRVTAGDMILTTTGTRHSLRNVGDTPLDWLVIELLAPATAAVVRGLPETPEGTGMKSRIVNLREEGTFDPREVFAGPLEEVAIQRLAHGDDLSLEAAGREYTIFVLSGNGRAVHPDTDVELVPGTSVTLPLGARLTIQPGVDGLELFRASLAVPGRGAR